MSNARTLEHALINHLSVILGFSEFLLQDVGSNDPHRADLAEIHRAAAAAVEIVSGRLSSDPAAGAPPDGLDAVERRHIVRVLGEVQGNKLAAARRLGISRRTLYRRLARHGLR